MPTPSPTPDAIVTANPDKTLNLNCHDGTTLRAATRPDVIAHVAAIAARENIAQHMQVTDATGHTRHLIIAPDGTSAPANPNQLAALHTHRTHTAPPTPAQSHPAPPTPHKGRQLTPQQLAALTQPDATTDTAPHVASQLPVSNRVPQPAASPSPYEARTVTHVPPVFPQTEHSVFTPEPYFGAPTATHPQPPAAPAAALPLGRPDAARIEATSFLVDRTAQAPEPPRISWWQRLFGGEAAARRAHEDRQSEWEDALAISQQWPSPKTIAVINGKGGAGKTPATVLLSALFARHGGTGVLAWDSNITRGTLGWRTEQSPHHDATVLDLLPHTATLLNTAARASDLSAFVHHQTADKFDVLRSNPLLLSTDQKLTVEQLDAIHAVATKYSRITVMDSGNDEGDALWLRMIDHADHIVVPTSTRPDHAEAARLLLLALHARDAHSRGLAERATVVVSQADRDEAAPDAVAGAFQAIARSVVTIPYDPAMRDQWLRLDALAQATQRAYLRAAAEVAKSF